MRGIPCCSGPPPATSRGGPEVLKRPSRDLDPTLLGRLVAEAVADRCPPPEDLLEAAGRSDHAALDPVLSAHLAVCDPCRAAMGVLAETAPEGPAWTSPRRERTWKRRLPFSVAAAVLLMAVFLVSRDTTPTIPRSARAAVERGDLTAAAVDLDEWLRRSADDALPERREAALDLLRAGLPSRAPKTVERPPRPGSLVFRGPSSSVRRILAPIGPVRTPNPQLLTTPCGAAGRVRLRRFGAGDRLEEVASFTIGADEVRKALARNGALAPGRYHLLVESPGGGDMVEFRIPPSASIQALNQKLQRIHDTVHDPVLREAALGMTLLEEGYRLEALRHLRKASAALPRDRALRRMVREVAGQLGLEP